MTPQRFAATLALTLINATVTLNTIEWLTGPVTPPLNFAETASVFAAFTVGATLAYLITTPQKKTKR